MCVCVCMLYVYNFIQLFFFCFVQLYILINIFYNIKLFVINIIFYVLYGNLNYLLLCCSFNGNDLFLHGSTQRFFILFFKKNICYMDIKNIFI